MPAVQLFTEPEIATFQCPTCPALNYMIIGFAVGIWVGVMFNLFLLARRQMKEAQEQRDRDLHERINK